jgi:hypothetical protein
MSLPLARTPVRGADHALEAELAAQAAQRVLDRGTPMTPALESLGSGAGTPLPSVMRAASVAAAVTAGSLDTPASVVYGGRLLPPSSLKRPRVPSAPQEKPHGDDSDMVNCYEVRWAGPSALPLPAPRFRSVRLTFDAVEIKHETSAGRGRCAWPNDKMRREPPASPVISPSPQDQRELV